MLAERIQQWYRDHEELGRQAGLQEGRQAAFQEGFQEGFQAGFLEGRREGLALAAVVIIEARFGPAEPALRDRINAASEEDLIALVPRAATAQSLSTLLAG